MVEAEVSDGASAGNVGGAEENSSQDPQPQLILRLFRFVVTAQSHVQNADQIAVTLLENATSQTGQKPSGTCAETADTPSLRSPGV